MKTAQTLREAVTERLKSSSGAVGEKVFEVLLSKEIDRRSTMLLEALDKRDGMLKEARKFKPDMASYASDGTVVAEAWSKPALDKRNKQKEKLDRLEKAIEAALEGTDTDFSKLQEAIKKCGDTSDDSGKTDSKSE